MAIRHRRQWGHRYWTGRWTSGGVDGGHCLMDIFPVTEMAPNARRFRLAFLLALLAGWLVLAAVQLAQQPVTALLPDTASPAGSMLGPLPLQFEPNLGQTDDSARF